MSYTDSSQTIYRVGTLTYTKRTLGLLFVWLLWGDVCYMLMESVAPSILPLTLKHLGASNAVMGLIITTIPVSISAVLNPFISVASDRYRSRLGRRIPFIVYTLPALLISLVGLGYAGSIGPWIAIHFLHSTSLSRATISIVTIGAFMVVFTFANSFVGAVFWYLFNDVVPEHLLARFMSLFRLISMLTASAYNIFVFKYAGTHAPQIMSGVALLYFVGFGVMCLNVREGKYPPPPSNTDGKTGVVSTIKTYATECLSIRHYWLVFLSSVFGALMTSVGIFMIFFYQTTGLNLGQIGRLNGAMNIAVAALIPVSGWLADRFHPIRIVIAGYIVTIFVAAPATFVWLFWHPNSNIAFLGWMAISILLIAPQNALIGIFDPPMLMTTFPRSRFGQFCSANNLIRSGGYVVGGVLSGVFLDRLGVIVPSHDKYLYLPAWQIAFAIPTLICLLLLYRSWKRYGGDTNYVAPIPGESVDQRLHEEIAETDCLTAAAPTEEDQAATV